MKQKRRTLKIRGYAQTCRNKNASQRHDLEECNKRLLSEMEAIAEEINEVKQERDKLKLELEEIMQIRQEQPLLFPPLEKVKTEIEMEFSTTL